MDYSRAGGSSVVLKAVRGGSHPTPYRLLWCLASLDKFGMRELYLKKLKDKT